LNQQPYKLCPRCQTPAALDAATCAQCGRQYRTQFVPPEEQTQVFNAPPMYQPPAAVNATIPPDAPPKGRSARFKVALVVASLLLISFFSWKAFTTFGGREVILNDTMGFIGVVPMATRDAHDLDVWQGTLGGRYLDDAGGRQQMANDGRIVLLGSGVRARLLWVGGNIAHVHLTTGVSSGTEGAVSKYNLLVRDLESNEVKPLYTSTGSPSSVLGGR
jgi:hypothetical protein